MPVTIAYKNTGNNKCDTVFQFHPSLAKDVADMVHRALNGEKAPERRERFNKELCRQRCRAEAKKS